ncbi:MAG: hypothetical protein HY052_04245 [Proteobacteria bacterium]|nr:hypothetical protein [Pseudomonadota bacterium]
MTTPAKRKPAVELKAEDIALANGLVTKFNIASAAKPAARVTTALGMAVEFVSSVADDLLQGHVIFNGSAMHGPDLFLDQATAVKTGSQEDTPLDTFKKFTVTKKMKSGLESVRKAFSLKSDRQAASLCLKAYNTLCDGMWRGNRFWMEDKAGVQQSFDDQQFFPKRKTAPSKKDAPRDVD